jgi:hypothetical protein
MAKSCLIHIRLHDLKHTGAILRIMARARPEKLMLCCGSSAMKEESVKVSLNAHVVHSKAYA